MMKDVVYIINNTHAIICCDIHTIHGTNDADVYIAGHLIVTI